MTEEARNIFLIGYRGTGKTTVARLLGARLDRKWVDADDELEKEAGRTIKQIFAEDGESVFRDLETRVLCRLATAEKRVVALGGGVILRDENRRILKTGAVVWLQAAAETISQRVASDPTTDERRPNLTASGGYDEICRLLRDRLPLYQQCADVEVDTEGRTPDQIVDVILSALGIKS